MPHLPAGYTIRHPRQDDIPAIIEVLYQHDLAETGEADRYSPDDILSEWEGIDIDADAWVIVAPTGTIAGYGTLTTNTDAGRFISDAYVHPAYYGRGIGSMLIDLMEARAAELIPTLPGSSQLVLENNVIANNEAARTLLEARGYILTRAFFHMHIQLDRPPEQPIWPEGIHARSSDGSEEDISRAHAVIEESFQDHWQHTPVSYEDWLRMLVRENFDPALWFFAQDGDEIAGAIICQVREENNGWIARLGVRRPWRKHGLGAALLREAFSAFYSRGIYRVGLGVDGQSLTGAQRLYERVGMHITMHVGHYEKEFRASNET